MVEKLSLKEMGGLIIAYTVRRIVVNKREVLIILNKLKDVVDNESIEAELVLNQVESTNLYKYLIELKKCHEKDVELIDKIISLIQKNKGV